MPWHTSVTTALKVTPRRLFLLVYKVVPIHCITWPVAHCVHFKRKCRVDAISLHQLHHLSIVLHN
jgi:hypothetical protein